jgi:serine/threonine-protein kinase
MELVEGPTLADRIARGAIPLDEALPIAKQIAEALEAAHEQGIIHRDLKPANIKVRPDGAVKVLDFGLAKALDPAGSGVNAMNSPTLTVATLQGVILGTAGYMSPEQARGKPVDKRTDIWAFGVAFEMLTGGPVAGGYVPTRSPGSSRTSPTGLPSADAPPYPTTAAPLPRRIRRSGCRTSASRVSRSTKGD